MGKSTKSEAEEEITFEEAIQSLEQIVKDMESERLPLDQLVQRYETGSRLLRTCEKRIREAEQRIEVIAAGESGPELTPFEGEARETTKAPPKKQRADARGRSESQEQEGQEEPGDRSGEDDDDEEIQLF